MTSVAKGTFEITMTPAAAEVGGAVGRLDFTKTWSGDLQGAGSGVLLSCGDSQAGEAGYVAVETVDGHLDGRDGGFALQQFGLMHDGSQTLRYEVAPGSGRGALTGSPESCNSPSRTAASTATSSPTTSEQLRRVRKADR